jgi:subtilisin
MTLMKSISTKIVTMTAFPLLLIGALAWALPQEAANHDSSGMVGVAPVVQPNLTPFQHTNIASSTIAGRSAATDEAFSALISKAKVGGPVRVIIGFDVPFQPEGNLAGTEQVRAQRGNIARAQANLLRRLSALDGKSVKKFSFIPYMALQVEANGLARLKDSPEVVSIEEDLLLQAALAESVPLIGGTAAWASGYSGAGQTVAILDTGFDKTHPFLAGRVVSEVCYSTTDASSTSLCPAGVTESTSPGSAVNCVPATGNQVDDCKHGTHVAGIAAGKGDGFSGVAKDSNLIAIQVFSRPLAGGRLFTYYSDVIRGLERVQVLSSSLNIAAVNLSLGAGLNASHCDATFPAFKDKVDSLRSLGIATVISSGNDSK